MSSHPFPHAITILQSSLQEQSRQTGQLEQHSPSQSQAGPDRQFALLSSSPSPSPPSSPPQANLAIINPIRHFYSPLLSSPPLGSSPATIVYSPLSPHPDSQSQSQSQPQWESESESQQLLAPLPPPPSPASHNSKQARQARSLRSKRRYPSPPPPLPPHHHLLAPFIPPSFSESQRQHQHQTPISEHIQTPTQNPIPNPSLNPTPLPTSTTYTTTYSLSSPHPNLPPFPNFPISSSQFLPTSFPSYNSSSSSSSPPYHSDSFSFLIQTPYSQSYNEIQELEDLRVRRAKLFCTVFTGVLVLMLIGVGVGRWIVYG